MISYTMDIERGVLDVQVGRIVRESINPFLGFGSDVNLIYKRRVAHGLIRILWS